MDETITEAFIQQFITGSSLDLDGIRLLERLIQTHNARNVLELGSGVSTLVFAKNASTLNHIYSVDDGKKYLDEAASRVPVAVKSRFTFIHAPIKKFVFKGMSFSTYSSDEIKKNVNDKIDFLFIDGPYARMYGRTATLFLASEFLASHAIIVLDDALRDFEKEAFDQWKKVWGAGIELLEEHKFRKGLRVFRLKKPQKHVFMPFGWKRKAKEILGI